MYRIGIRLMLLLYIPFLLSCNESKNNQLISLLQEWESKEIIFPINSVFTIQGNDTVQFSTDGKYKLLTYIDSVGCTDCKLNLQDWKQLIHEVDSISSGSTKVLFYLFPKNGLEIYQKFRIARFDYPVCIDREDSLNLLNRFPTDMTFQTFLLDSDNRVLAVGNPVQNLRIRELYLRLIQGESLQHPSIPQTTVRADRQEHHFGTFDVRQEQQTVFRLANTGHHPLVVAGIDRSCDCVKVTCSPDTVPPGQTLELKVTYQAGDVIEFEESITVHSNAAGSPLRFVVSGEAR